MKKNYKNAVTILFCVVVIVAIAAAVICIYRNNQRQTAVLPSAERQTESDNLDINTVLHNGVEYKRNTNIETVLFMGVDKKNQEMLEEMPVNGGQADCLILFVINKETKKIQLIQISRNAMVPISMYNTDGDFVKSKNAQICLQYAYGDGRSRSCWMTEQVVSALFYNIPIDGYVALNVEGISMITTAIGGVDLTVPNDYTAIDPSLEEGAQVNLQGDLAVRYVQYRDINVSGSNQDRMERQTQFLTALASQMKNQHGESDWYTSLQDAANPYMVTDVEGETIKRLSSYTLDSEKLSVPGVEVQGTEYDEYEVDLEELYQMVLDIFYEPAES